VGKFHFLSRLPGTVRALHSQGFFSFLFLSSSVFFSQLITPERGINFSWLRELFPEYLPRHFPISLFPWLRVLFLAGNPHGTIEYFSHPLPSHPFPFLDFAVSLLFDRSRPLLSILANE